MEPLRRAGNYQDLLAYLAEPIKDRKGSQARLPKGLDLTESQRAGAMSHVRHEFAYGREIPVPTRENTDQYVAASKGMDEFLRQTGNLSDFDSAQLHEMRRTASKYHRYYFQLQKLLFESEPHAFGWFKGGNHSEPNSENNG